MFTKDLFKPVKKTPLRPTHYMVTAPNGEKCCVTWEIAEMIAYDFPARFGDETKLGWKVSQISKPAFETYKQSRGIKW